LSKFKILRLLLGYVTNVLDDAKAYANHAKKKAIDLDDVKLAVTMQIDQSFTSPPDREVKFHSVLSIKFIH